MSIRMLGALVDDESRVGGARGVSNYRGNTYCRILSRSLQWNSPLRRLIGTASAGSLSYKSSPIITWTAHHHTSRCNTNSVPSNTHMHTSLSLAISSLSLHIPSHLTDQLCVCVCMCICAHACECCRHQVVQSASDRKCWNAINLLKVESHFY